MHLLTSAILITWRRNGAYAQRLVGDLEPAQFLAQPVGGRRINHPAWILSHLNVYAPIAAAMLQGQPFADPIDHEFGQKSTVLDDPGAYVPPVVLVERYRTLHDHAERALIAAEPVVFEAPTPLERWRTQHPRTGEMLVTLMVKHESFHLGQLSAWRRAMGLPSVAM